MLVMLIVIKIENGKVCPTFYRLQIKWWYKCQN